jgi:hypothetical protein
VDALRPCKRGNDAVLPEAALPWTQPVWAVFYRQGALAPRVAARVDFWRASWRRKNGRLLLAQRSTGSACANFGRRLGS